MSTSAIDTLVDAVEAAIREYDRSGDHLRHGAKSDCIRCGLLAALPHSACDRVERSHRLARATGAPVDVVREHPHSERAIYEAQNREDARAKADGRKPRLIATMADIARIESTDG